MITREMSEELTEVKLSVSSQTVETKILLTLIQEL